jgi:hypothetical protein
MLKRLRVASIVVTLLVMKPALAEPANDASPAQVHAAADAFDQGRESYKSGDMVVAAEAFEQADSRAGSPIALEYAIRARDKAGQLDRAATLSALAKKRYPGETELEKLADDVLRRARRESYELSIECSEPCELVIDGKLVHGKSDFERVVFLSSGSHLLRAGFSESRSGSKTVEATAGEQGQIQFDAPAETPATKEVEEAAPRDAEIESESAPRSAPVVADPPRESSGWSPAVFWVGTGLTAALGAVTLWSGLDTVKNPGEDKVQEACRDERPDCQTLYEDGRRRQTRTNVLLGVTGGVGLATILIGAVGTDWGDESSVNEVGSGRGKKKSARSGIAPWLVLGDGALVGAEGRF